MSILRCDVEISSSLRFTVSLFSGMSNGQLPLQKVVKIIKYPFIYPMCFSLSSLYSSTLSFVFYLSTQKNHTSNPNKNDRREALQNIYYRLLSFQ